MSDKRQVHTDALATLGTIITEKEKRDAIHLAVIPIMAPDSERTLYPGDHVDKNGYTAQYGHRFDNSIGIVDPFIESIVKPGEWFWCFIYPRQITSLRHVWVHPAFDDEAEERRMVNVGTFEYFGTSKEPSPLSFKLDKHEKQQEEKLDRIIEIVKDANTITKDDSRKWMEEYAEQLGYGKWSEDYDEHLYTVEEVLNAAKLWIDEGESTTIFGEEYDVPDEFWYHYEVITGKEVPLIKREVFFNCSC